MKQIFPYYRQLDAMDCGPTCLRMIAKYYGKSYSLQTLRARSFISHNGVSMLGISDAAESIRFRTSGVRVSFEQLAEIFLCLAFCIGIRVILSFAMMLRKRKGNTRLG